MSVFLTINSEIKTEIADAAVNRTIQILKRDLQECCVPSEKEGCMIYLYKKELPQEMFVLECNETENQLTIAAADTLGFVYGLYEISRTILGVKNFWFWNDQKFEKKEQYEIPSDFCQQSSPYAVKYRGWFVNDEVLISAWTVGRRKEGPWEMVMEALLRCGGNLIIPGTDRNSDIYRSLAAEFGLYLTHHHAEPLGAPMFAREYPRLQPSYSLYPEMFEELWEKGIESQKGMKVVWNIGFRGQGDRPFWEDDAKYDTPKARGALMSELIRKQYDLVKCYDSEAVCCTNLYGETMELYRAGFLELPEDVIKIWADNGFGKMVTRRQGNHNPRISALPMQNEKSMHHGIYYHVSFYDLQAANHITMLQNKPDFICGELEKVLECGIRDYWIINCSNVKPHVYYLDLISDFWKNGKSDISIHRKKYAECYYGKEDMEIVEAALKEYAEAAVQYGIHEDEYAGEQFQNHVSRMLVSNYLKDKTKPSTHLKWFADTETFEQQIGMFQEKCIQGVANYKKYLTRYEEKVLLLFKNREARQLFSDSLLLHAKLHYYSFCGAELVCKSLLEALKEYNPDYQKAFYYAGKAREYFLKADESLKQAEHGKWHGFYKNECLTDIKQSAWFLETLMGYLRNLDDGPEFYKWQRDFLYSEEDRRVLLILVMENHLKDLELFELMKEKYEN